MALEYFPNGNIKRKTGLGEFYYGSGLDVNAGPHALVGVEDIRDMNIWMNLD